MKNNSRRDSDKKDSNQNRRSLQRNSDNRINQKLGQQKDSQQSKSDVEMIDTTTYPQRQTNNRIQTRRSLAQQQDQIKEKQKSKREKSSFDDEQDSDKSDDDEQVQGCHHSNESRELSQEISMRIPPRSILREYAQNQIDQACQKFTHRDERFFRYKENDKFFIIEDVVRLVKVDVNEIWKSKVEVKWFGFGDWHTIEKLDFLLKSENVDTQLIFLIKRAINKQTEEYLRNFTDEDNNFTNLCYYNEFSQNDKSSYENHINRCKNKFHPYFDIDRLLFIFDNYLKNYLCFHQLMDEFNNIDHINILEQNCLEFHNIKISMLNDYYKRHIINDRLRNEFALSFYKESLQDDRTIRKYQQEIHHVLEKAKEECSNMIQNSQNRQGDQNDLGDDSDMMQL
eukprot:403334414